MARILTFVPNHKEIVPRNRIKFYLKKTRPAKNLLLGTVPHNPQKLASAKKGTAQHYLCVIVRNGEDRGDDIIQVKTQYHFPAACGGFDLYPSNPTSLWSITIVFSTNNNTYIIIIYVEHYVLKR